MKPLTSQLRKMLPSVLVSPFFTVPANQILGVERGPPGPNYDTVVVDFQGSFVAACTGVPTDADDA